MAKQEPLRVAYVVKRYPRYSETFIVNEILSHEASGLSVEIFALLPPSDTHFQNSIAQVKAAVHYLPSESPKGIDLWNAFQNAGSVLPDFWLQLSQAQGVEVRSVYQAITLACEIQKREIHHIHAHFATAATSVARLASFFAKVPYTFTSHAKDIFHQDVDNEDLLQKLADAAGAITISQYNLEYLNDRFGAAANRVRCIYNGLNLEAFPFQSTQSRFPEILGIGRLVEKKGFTDLLDACAILAKREVAFHCSIIGTGDLQEVLSEKIRRLKLEQYVEMLGPLPQFEVIKHLQKAAVLAAPCIVGLDGNRDGLPTVLLEAMALGTCCVSTDVTGIPEAVQHGVTGLLVPERTPTALADALQQLILDPQLRTELSLNARRLIESHFDIHENSRKIREVFQDASNIFSQLESEFEAKV